MIIHRINSDYLDHINKNESEFLSGQFEAILSHHVSIDNIEKSLSGFKRVVHKYRNFMNVEPSMNCYVDYDYFNITISIVGETFNCAFKVFVDANLDSTLALLRNLNDFENETFKEYYNA
jgi:hypothetical protein